MDEKIPNNKEKWYRKEKIKGWLKKDWNFFLIILGLVIIILYLYYFFMLKNQPIWWDEGDYLAIGKELAFGRLEKPDWWPNFIRVRPLVFPIMLAVLFKINLGETITRFFLEVALSLGSIFLIYIVSRELFNKTSGIIAGVLISVNWVFMFYSFRFLTDIPSLFFSALSIYFFWVRYEKPIIQGKEERPIFLYLSVFFGAISFMTRYIAILNLIVIAFYLICTRKFSIIKDKHMWIALLISILSFSPYAIFNLHTSSGVFPALSWYHGAESTSVHRPPAWNTISFHLPNFFGFSGDQPTMFNSAGFILLVIGIIWLSSIILYIDIIIKQDDKSKNNLLFCFIGVIVPIIYFIFGIRAVDSRYFIATAPLMFPVIAKAIEFISSLVSSYIKIKYISYIIIISLLIIPSYQSIKFGNSFIEDRKNSYKPIRDSGLWIKDNSDFNDKVICASVTQMQYYTERNIYDFYATDNDDTKIWDNCFIIDAQLTQWLSGNESCQRMTEWAFNKKISKLKPRFFIIHVFEPVFTPEWAYTYPQRYNLTFLKAFGSDPNNPMLLVYEFPKNFNPNIRIQS